MRSRSRASENERVRVRSRDRRLERRIMERFRARFVSLFIDNLHPKTEVPGLWNFISNVMPVRDVFIPSRQRAGRKVKYGFIRVDNEAAASRVIEEYNGARFMGIPITVSRAKYSQGDRVSKQDAAYSRSVREGIGAELQTQGRDHRNFAEVVKCNLQKSDNEEKKVDTHYVDGKEGAEIREITCATQVTEKEWLARCAVGLLRNPSDWKALIQSFHLEGIYSCTPKPLGGNQVLLEFCSKEMMAEFVQDAKQWWNRWFSKVNPWVQDAVNGSRNVWLRCEGVPLQVWNETFFRGVAEFWGTFMGIDEDTVAKRRLTVGRILICTEEEGIIANPVKVVVDGASFIMRVYEELESFKDGIEFEKTGNMVCLGESSHIPSLRLHGDDYQVFSINPVVSSEVQSKKKGESKSKRAESTQSRPNINSGRAGKLSGEFQMHNLNFENGGERVEAANSNSFSSGLRDEPEGLLASDFVLDSVDVAGTTVGLCPKELGPKTMELVVELGPLVVHEGESGGISDYSKDPLHKARTPNPSAVERLNSSGEEDEGDSEGKVEGLSDDEEGGRTLEVHSAIEKRGRGRSLNTHRGGGRYRSVSVIPRNRSSSMGKIFGYSRFVSRASMGKNGMRRQGRSRSRNKRMSEVESNMKGSQDTVIRGGDCYEEDLDKKCNMEAIKAYEHSKKLGIKGGDSRNIVIPKIKLREMEDRCKKATVPEGRRGPGRH